MWYNQHSVIKQSSIYCTYLCKYIAELFNKDIRVDIRVKNVIIKEK